MPAAAPRNRTPVLLVGKPQVSAVDKGAADLIYASIIAGLHDALLRRIDPPASREFGAVFTERSITDEQKTKIAPLVFKLTATGVAANQSVLWTQLSGPEIGAGNVNNQVLTFQLDSKKSGYYVFKLAVSSGTLQTAEAKISFLAAPSIHADAGRSSYTGRVGQPILLDGSASYDVLGDQISFTWVLTDPEQQRAARIVDNHGSHPRCGEVC